MNLPFVDIVDIKPANMEELTEVITAAEFHPIHCNLFMYSSSKGSIKLSDMRASALCDQSAKGNKMDLDGDGWILKDMSRISVSGTWRSSQSLLLFWNHFICVRCQIQQWWSIHSLSWLLDIEDLGYQYGQQAFGNNLYPRSLTQQAVRLVWKRLHLWQIWMYL